GARDGGAIMIDGVKYPHGLGVHSDSKVVVNLDGKYNQFRADVGIDDEVGNDGSVDFQVWADGKLVWDSGTVTGADAGKKCYVDVQGVKQLWLVVTHTSGGYSGDHADWGGAYLTAA